MSGLPAVLDADTRKHLWRGLDRLGARRRLDFLQWCCQRANGIGGIKTAVTTYNGTTGQAWDDVQMLCFQHGLSLQTACEELERRLREG